MPARGATGATPDRLELAERVRELRIAGRKHREVAAILDISRSYATELWLDPDGSKARARKDSYSGRCERCGAATTGSDGHALAPRICSDCSNGNRSVKWTRGSVIASFWRFAALFDDRAPAVADVQGLAPSLVDRYSPERRREIERARLFAPLPPASIVRKLFGGWGEACEAAGFGRNTGGPTSWRRPREHRGLAWSRAIRAQMQEEAESRQLEAASSTKGTGS